MLRKTLDQLSSHKAARESYVVVLAMEHREMESSEGREKREPFLGHGEGRAIRTRRPPIWCSSEPRIRSTRPSKAVIVRRSQAPRRFLSGRSAASSSDDDASSDKSSDDGSVSVE